jgi:hypothetical protein
MLAMPEFSRPEMPGVALYELLPLIDSSDMVRAVVLLRCASQRQRPG